MGRGQAGTARRGVTLASAMTTPEQFISRLDEPKRSELARLHALIQKTLPAFAPSVSATMIGYGKYHYRYPSGREGDSYRVALASNKTGISIYVSAVDAGGWLAEQEKERLGKASVGKSCIRFKRIADIDVAALTRVLRKARNATAPGEVGAPHPAKKPVEKVAGKKRPT
jgi:hypothetical protein